jgi:hypothetical protein
MGVFSLNFDMIQAAPGIITEFELDPSGAWGENFITKVDTGPIVRFKLDPMLYPSALDPMPAPNSQFYVIRADRAKGTWGQTLPGAFVFYNYEETPLYLRLIKNDFAPITSLTDKVDLQRTWSIEPGKQGVVYFQPNEQVEFFFQREFPSLN